MSDAAICPASWCSEMGCGPAWEFADRIHITRSCSRHGENNWFFRSRLTDCCAMSSFAHLRFDDLGRCCPQAATAGAL